VKESCLRIMMQRSGTRTSKVEANQNKRIDENRLQKKKKNKL